LAWGKASEGINRGQPRGFYLAHGEITREVKHRVSTKKGILQFRESTQINLNNRRDLNLSLKRMLVGPMQVHATIMRSPCRSGAEEANAHLVRRGGEEDSGTLASSRKKHCRSQGDCAKRATTPQLHSPLLGKKNQ